jgi:hypothetical protein
VDQPCQPFHCSAGRSYLTVTSISIGTPQYISPEQANGQQLAYLRAMNVPAPIEQVVLKMAAKAPAQRYQSARVLIDVLTEALSASQLSLPGWRSGEQPPETLESPVSSLSQQCCF